MILKRDWRHTTYIMLALAASLSMAGCKKNEQTVTAADSMMTGSTGTSALETTASLGKIWEKDTKNISAGFAYADSLQSIGQTEQEIQVYSVLAKEHPQNNQVQLTYAKKLILADRSTDALTILQKLTQTDTKNWQAYAVYGSALDQYGQYDLARENYQKALILKPEQPTIMNNFGMSYAMEGNLKEAEKILRQASLLPEAKKYPRIQQNLALVVGLQGDYEGARKIASANLPPNEVDDNIAYLKKMMSQPNTWQQLSAAKK